MAGGSGGNQAEMRGYEDRLIKKAAERSKRTSTFDTRADHLKMENKCKISSCFTWANAICVWKNQRNAVSV